MVDEQLLNCDYCNRDISLKEWKFNWDDIKRYESLICDCGKKNWRKAVEGSGHHSEINGLESSLKAVCSHTWSK